MGVLDKDIEKLYYTIGEVAEIFQVNTSLIRFWEKEFDLSPTSKNKKGNRLYTKKDIEQIKKVFHLVKEKGYTLQGAKDQLKNGKPSTDSAKTEALEKLKQIREQLINLKNSL